MKSLSIITTVLILASSGGLYGDTILFGKKLVENFPTTKNEPDYNILRSPGHLSVDQVVKYGDEFLHDTFGRDLNLTVFAVSMFASRTKSGGHWCWCITYVYPDNKDDKYDRTFRVYLDRQGKPLMKVYDVKPK